MTRIHVRQAEREEQRGAAKRLASEAMNGIEQGLEAKQKKAGDGDVTKPKARGTSRM